VTDRVCPLCKRHVSQLSRHHLLPRARGGKEEHVLHICFDCHDAVHEFFDNSELARRYTSIEALLSNERFARHVAWLAKQHPERRFAAKRPRDRHKRR